VDCDQRCGRDPSESFYDRLNQILDEHKFDTKVERLCHKFYKKSPFGRPSMAPGVYFRSLLIGYFEGLDSERGIAWRKADSLSLRKFLGYALDEATPDHSTISRTRRLFWLETHKAVFRWALKILNEEGLISGRTVSIDATTLEANAALKSIVRRDNGQSYNDYLKELAKAAGMENPSREQLARLDRKKKGSNQEWMSPSDPDARITKMKDGRTHLAHKGEHAVDLTSGALLAVTLQPANEGDTTTIHKTLAEAQTAAREINGKRLTKPCRCGALQHARVAPKPCDGAFQFYFDSCSSREDVVDRRSTMHAYDSCSKATREGALRFGLAGRGGRLSPPETGLRQNVSSNYDQSRRDQIRAADHRLGVS
jgi:transposase